MIKEQVKPFQKYTEDHLYKVENSVEIYNGVSKKFQSSF